MPRSSAAVTTTTEQVPVSDALGADVVQALRTVTDGTVLAAYSLVGIEEKRAATPHESVGGILTLLEFRPSASKRGGQLAGSEEDSGSVWLVIRKPTRLVAASDVAAAQRKLQSVAFNGQNAVFRSCPLRRLVTRRVIRGAVCESDKKCCCATRVLSTSGSGLSEADASDSPSRTPRVRRRLFVTRFVEPSTSASGSTASRKETTEEEGDDEEIPLPAENNAATRASPVRRLVQHESAPARSSAWHSTATAAATTTNGTARNQSHAPLLVGPGRTAARCGKSSEPRKMPPVSRGVLMAMQRQQRQDQGKRGGPTPPASKGKGEVKWIRQWDSAAHRFYWYNQESAESRWAFDPATNKPEECRFASLIGQITTWHPDHWVLMWFPDRDLFEWVDRFSGEVFTPIR